MYFTWRWWGSNPRRLRLLRLAIQRQLSYPLGHYAPYKRSYHGRGLCLISLHYPSDRVTRFRCANTIIYIQRIPGSYGYRSLEIILILKIYKLQQIFRPRIISDTSTSEKLYNGEIKMYFT